MTDTGPFTELNSRRLGPVRRFFVGSPRAMDALVVALVAAISLTAATDGAPMGAYVASLVFAVAGLLALIWRRMRPLSVTGTIVALCVLSLAVTGSLSGLELALSCAIYAVASLRPARTAWLTVGAALLVSVGAAWLWSSTSAEPSDRGAAGGVVFGDERWGTTAGMLIVMLAAMAIGISVRNRREHLVALMNRANALATDRDRQTQLARAAERSRIAREMHDVVAHSLSVMVTLADGASASLERSPDGSRAALKELALTGRAALTDMRRVLGALQDDAPLEPIGQVQDLPALIERFRIAGLPVRCEGLRLDPPSDTGLQLAVYRIIQESLTNVLRHAQGTAQVDVELCQESDRWKVTVTDHGGVALVSDAGGSGLGLVGMRERVGLLGGSVEAGPWERGWRVHAEIPHFEVGR